MLREPTMSQADYDLESDPLQMQQHDLDLIDISYIYYSEAQKGIASKDFNQFGA